MTFAEEAGGKMEGGRGPAAGEGGGGRREEGGRRGGCCRRRAELGSCPAASVPPQRRWPGGQEPPVPRAQRGAFTCSPLCLPLQDGPAVKRMAVTFQQAQRVGCTLLKALLRFAFMVANNLVAIPSYVLYLIVLQPLRVLDSKLFWYIEGVLFKWLLAMVASWGWWAGYTGKHVLLTTKRTDITLAMSLITRVLWRGGTPQGGGHGGCFSSRCPARMHCASARRCRAYRNVS